MANYITVFEVAQTQRIDWAFILPGLAMMAVGIVALVRWKKPPGKWEPFAWHAVSILIFTFSALWTFGVGAATWVGRQRLMDALNSGQCSIVEGPVEDFDPMPAAGHKQESFRVGTTRFAYSDYISTGGFNRTRSHGGPIRPGLWVRIAHVDGVILRLEIEPVPPDAPALKAFEPDAG